MKLSAFIISGMFSSVFGIFKTLVRIFKKDTIQLILSIVTLLFEYFAEQNKPLSQLRNIHKSPTNNHKCLTNMNKSPTKFHKSLTSLHRSPIKLDKFQCKLHKSLTRFHKSPTNNHKCLTNMSKSPTKFHKYLTSLHRSPIKLDKFRCKLLKSPTRFHKCPTKFHKSPTRFLNSNPLEDFMLNVLLVSCLKQSSQDTQFSFRLLF